MNNTKTALQVSITGAQMKQIKSALKFMSKRYGLNYLAYGLFYINNNQLYFYVTDGSTSVKINLGETDLKQSFTFPLAQIREIKGIKADSKYEIVMEDNKLKFNDNGVTITLSTLDAEDYPKVKTVKYNASYAATNTYIKALTDALTYTGKSELRPILKGVLHKHGNIISTDSHRLFYKSHMFEIESPEFVVRPEAVTMVKELFSKEKELTILLSDEYVKYTNNNIEIESKLIEGNYPDVSRIMPQNFKTELTTNRKDLIAKLEQCEKIAKKEKSQVIRTEITDNNTTITATNEAGDTLQTEINGCFGDNINIGFNVSYLLDALKQMSDRDITFKFTGNMSPVVIEDSGNYHLVLPIRIYN